MNHINPLLIFQKKYKIPKLYSNLQLKNYVPFKTLSEIKDHKYIMDISTDWGIPTSFTVLDFKELPDNKDIFYELSSTLIPLESEVFQNSFLPPHLVSNVGLIDKIIDHRTIITDSKEDDYKFLLQWKGKPISDASWVTSNDILKYAPQLHSDLFSNKKATSSEMKSSNPEGMMENYFKNMNTRVLSEPILLLLLLLLIHEFEKLSIH